MITAKLVVAGIAVAAIGLAPKISAWIKSFSSRRNAEAGPGDTPGGPDRGPEGIKM